MVVTEDEGVCIYNYIEALTEYLVHCSACPSPDTVGLLQCSIARQQNYS